MLKKTYYLLLLIGIIISLSCQNNKQKDEHITVSQSDKIKINKILDSIKNFNSQTTDSLTLIANYAENEIKKIVPEKLFPFYLNKIGMNFYISFPHVLQI